MININSASDQLDIRYTNRRLHGFIKMMEKILDGYISLEIDVSLIACAKAKGNDPESYKARISAARLLYLSNCFQQAVADAYRVRNSTRTYISMKQNIIETEKQKTAARDKKNARRRALRAKVREEKVRDRELEQLRAFKRSVEEGGGRNE